MMAFFSCNLIYTIRLVDELARDINNEEKCIGTKKEIINNYDKRTKI
tara:strand:+ start:289 stop:429 length:141 start_codon:yes stop_codon:yes gene_type:complete